MAEKKETTLDERLAVMEQNMARLIAITTMQIEQGMKPADDGAVVDKLTEILDKMAGSQERAAELVAQAKRSEVRPSNTVVPMRSVFNPRGILMGDWQKPLLSCEMHIPYRAEDDMLTIEEVELLNLLADIGPGAYVVQRNDDTRVKLTVKCDRDESDTKTTRLVVSHDTAFRNEYFRTMPPLARMLRQMISQAQPHKAKLAHRIPSMDELNAAIEKGELAVSR